MSKSGGSAKVDTSGAEKAIERNTPKAYYSNLGALGTTRADFNKKTGQVSSKMDVNPLVNKALIQSLRGVANLGDLQKQRVQEYTKGAIEPFQYTAKENLENMFGRLGKGGRANSQGQNALATYAADQARNQGQQLVGLQEQARQNVLSQLGAQQSLAMTPYQTVLSQLSGQGQQLGSGMQQAGQSLANIQAQAALANQQAALQKQQSKGSGAGQLVGAGVGLASAFSDQRLKENIIPVGRLDNGLTVHLFNYKGDPTWQLGLIAQEVLMVNPHAVHIDPITEYLKVDYKEACL